MPDLLDPTMDANALLRMIRTDPETRSAIVMVIGGSSSGISAHGSLRDGADDYFASSLPGALLVDADDLAVSLKSKLTRRAQLEPVIESKQRSGIVSWPTAVVMIERLFLTAFRQNQPVGLVVLDLKVDEDTPILDRDIAREFRGGDVIARLDERHLVFALPGVSRRVLLRRIHDVYRKFGLSERGVRAIGLEFPIDGRSLDELLEIGCARIEQAAIDGAPMVVGADWQPWAADAADVMLIDPDRTLGAVLSATLGRRGLTVVHPLDALEALDELTTRNAASLPRVVLMELDQRGIDGLQMLRTMRDSGSLGRFGVLVLSSRVQESELQQAFELGADDFVPKPFSTPLLVHRLNRLLEI
ncbi:MAG: two-component system response regulator MtrA [Acidimicrobiales bacterium]|jgi:two-component system response regulator MtrA